MNELRLGRGGQRSKEFKDAGETIQYDYLGRKQNKYKMKKSTAAIGKLQKIHLISLYYYLSSREVLL